MHAPKPITTHSPNPDQAAIQAGQAVYTAATLKLYDALVLGVSNYLLWRCPTHRLLAFYRQHQSGEHLEIGVGSGFFPTYSKQPQPQRLVLVDLNPQTLVFGQRRLGRPVKVYQRNALEPLELPEALFQSVAMNYLLHCIPTSLAEKTVAFDHALAYLQTGGVLFGSTLLQGDAPRSRPARALMSFYNKKGVFHNQHDHVADLEHALASRCGRYHVEVVGCAALFWAIKD